MAWAVEKYKSRNSKIGDSPSVELLFLCGETDDELAIQAAVEAASPSTYHDLPRGDITVAQITPTHWEAKVVYGAKPPKEDDYAKFELDTTVGTQHITQSIETIARYPSMSVPDFKGAIGVEGDKVQGCDIPPTGSFKFSITKYHPTADVDSAYVDFLYRAAGKVNDDSVTLTVQGVSITFQAGELIHKGARGGPRNAKQWELSYAFEAEENVTNQTIGDITGIDKDGFDYLWVLYKDADDENSHVKVPKAVYVERVIRRVDYSSFKV